MAENKSEAYWEKEKLGEVTEQIPAQETTLRKVVTKLDEVKEEIRESSQSTVIASGTIDLLKSGTVEVTSIPPISGSVSILGGTIDVLSSGKMSLIGGTIDLIRAGTVDVSSLPPITGTVSITGGTIDLLKAGTVDISSIPPISGTVSISGGTIDVIKSGTVDVSSLPDISGTVSVNNFPSEYPLPSSQVSDLKNVYVTGGTIDTISGTVPVDIKADSVGLAKESTLSSIDSKITKCDTDNVKIVSPLSANNNVNVNIAENTAGIATENTLSDIKSNIDVALSTRASEDTLLKNLRSIAVQPVTGKGACLYSTDSAYDHWIDDTDRSFTSTDYTELTHFHILFPHLSFPRTFGIYFSVKVKGDGSNTVYIRFRSAWKGTLIEFSTTSSDYVHIEKRTSYKGMIHWDDLFYVEGKVSGGTGYLDFARARLVKVNVVEGWTGEVGEDYFHPIKIDSDGTVHTRIAKSSIAYDSTNDWYKVSIQNDAVGLATESTLSGIKSKTDNLSFKATNLYHNLVVLPRDSGYRWYTESTGKGGIIDQRQFNEVWNDTTDYSFTNTDYQTITYFKIREWGSEYGVTQFGVWAWTHGDGTNTVYVRVTVDGVVVGEKWTTSSTSVALYFHFPVRRKFTDWRFVYIQAKVSGGTGYITSAHARSVCDLPISLNYGMYNEVNLVPIKVDSDGTQHMKITKSIAYDSSNDRFKVGVQNFPSWFTSSTVTTNTLNSNLYPIKDYYSRYFNYLGGKKGDVYVANTSDVFWSDWTDYSFTNTSYTEITYCNLHGLMFGWVGVSTEIKGDGTNTVYCKVTDRGGHVLYEWSTTSSSAVRTWRKGFIAYWGYPDFNRIRIYCKVSGGTGYLTNVYAVIPAEDNRRIAFGWDYTHTDGNIYPLRVDSLGLCYTKPHFYDEEESAWVTARTDKNNYLIVRPWEDVKQNKIYTSGIVGIGGGSSGTFTVYNGRGVLKWLLIFISGISPSYASIRIKDGGTIIQSINGNDFMGVMDGVYPPATPNSSPYVGCWLYDKSNNKYYGWRVINTKHNTNIVIEVLNSSSATMYVKIQAIYIPY